MKSLQRALVGFGRFWWDFLVGRHPRNFHHGGDDAVGIGRRFDVAAPRKCCGVRLPGSRAGRLAGQRTARDQALGRGSAVAASSCSCGLLRVA